MSEGVQAGAGTGGPLLVMRSISKEFPGVKALSDVSFDVRPGEIHALCGENGAGKSTLMKVLSGIYGTGTYSGEIVIKGEVQHFKGIRDSERAGVAIIHQELSLVPEMNLGENIFIGREPSRFGVIDWNELYSRTRKLLDSVGLKISSRRKVKDLGVGQQQLVEIAKALSHNPRILVLDEPTSALTESEVEILMKVLRDLRSSGVSCILISHKLNEVLEIADRVTVLRDGKTVSSFERKDATQARIVSEMVGRELKDFFPKVTKQIGSPVLEVKNLTVAHPSRPGRNLLDDISFQVHKGEVLGIAGLMGAGRSELLLSIFGVPVGKATRPAEIKVEGKRVHIKSPGQAIKLGLSLLPEDRKKLGLLLNETVARNMTLSALDRLSSMGVIDTGLETVRAKEKVQALRVKTASLDVPVKNLSGGNQQKVVLAKCLMTDPKVLFLDEPTRGIDVGAKAEIYKLINELAAQGLAVVMVSSELPEVLGMSDRILVMSEGRIAGEFEAKQATQEKIMAAATSFH